ncbi:hypothetical protein I6F30_16300 [Bradyrhizobium sp. NBAIM20]|uniref:hypothetical protein n=1 Tax=unclassified Bradyrhizobium TaxID=2631580 RepID=UPI001CD21866|nr:MULTISPECIES: hypothetical protein [unclassified Bradyrhizobium]MCA1412683.1 hypothetical protein [Bradyrhizobium sp. NBAIM20]MCA1463467.1 hypothetical protein [Bradyrhizobium sp. NBAIM18]
MTNDITTSQDGPPQADDGFSGSFPSRRIGRGSYLKWNDKQGWVDRDGVAAPSPLLVVDVGEILRRWKNNEAEYILEKPLPNAGELNAAIPIQEWELGVDGKPRPPWAHTVMVYLVNLSTGENYTYSGATVGAHIAYDALKESVMTMRSLRGTRCMPLVNLSSRPMKMKFGQGRRPHFEIIGWRTPGDGGNAVPAAPPAPQLTGPAAAEKAAASVTALNFSDNSARSTQQARDQHQANTGQTKPKPLIDVSSETLSTMTDVKPVTTAEMLNDRIVF